MISGMRFAAVGVTNIDSGLGLFRDVMGFKVENRGTAHPLWSAAWGITNSAMEVAELSAGGYPYGRILLLAFDPAPTVSVRLERHPTRPDGPLDVGPKALDFYVRAPIDLAIQTIKSAGYRFWSAPHRHEIGPTVSEEVVFTGPDGIPLLLMVGHSHSARQLRPGSPEGQFSEVATVSIVVADRDETKRFYRDTLGLTIITEAESAPEFADLVAELVGAPKGTRIGWMTFAEPGEASGKILALHSYDSTGPRLTGRMKPGALGFSLLGHTVPDIGNMHKKLVSEGYEVVTSPTEIERFARKQRIMLVRGPNEEMLELMEAVPQKTDSPPHL